MVSKFGLLGTAAMLDNIVSAIMASALKERDDVFDFNVGHDQLANLFFHIHIAIEHLFHQGRSTFVDTHSTQTQARSLSNQTPRELLNSI